MKITAAADGSALGNPGPAGWAWYIDENNWASGGWLESTNNRGELMAVLNLLESSAHCPRLEIHFLCDSQYVINSLTQWMPGWKRRGWRKSNGDPVLNADLMKRLDAALEGRRVSFDWVKGHAGHELNERADDLARGAATAFQNGTNANPGPGLTLDCLGQGQVDPVVPAEEETTPDPGTPEDSQPTLF